jgi:hypothetical protein
LFQYLGRRQHGPNGARYSIEQWLTPTGDVTQSLDAAVKRYLAKSAHAKIATHDVGKWQHDGVDRYEMWWLGEEVSPIASVHPQWGVTRGTGIGKPDDWLVIVGDKRARAATIGEAKKLALAMLKDVPSP